MRNRIVHVYFEIDLDILGDTVNNKLSELIKKLEKIPELIINVTIKKLGSFEFK
jgi:uncharacterized protein with HEPN domain